MSQAITVTVTVGASATGTITNTATVSGNQPDPNPANNTSTVVTTVTPQTDLSIVKTGSPNPVIAGNNLTYTLTATNNGPSTATGVTISDPLPSGETFVSSTGGTFNSGSDTLTDAVGTLAVGQSQTITVTVTVGASVTGTLTNTATVTSNQPDPTPGNNTSTVVTTVTPQADLSITKAVSGTTVSPGGELGYGLVITNNGPSTATNVTVSDPLPSSITYNSDTYDGSFDASTNTDSFTLGTLAPGQSISIAIDTTVNFNAPTGTLTNTATVSSSTPDPNLANNSASASTTVTEIYSSIAGTVYVDPNNTGVYVPSDKVLAGVTVYLTGTDRLGNSVSLSTVTNATGQYNFGSVISGNYNVSSSPVTGYKAGKITTGTGASADAVDGTFSNTGARSGQRCNELQFRRRSGDATVLQTAVPGVRLEAARRRTPNWL